MPNNVPNLYRWGVFRRLANRLESLDRFLEAMTDMMKFSDAEDRQIRHYGRKIISLTEIANATMNSSNIGATLLVICSEEQVPYKAAFFRMLVLIRRRRSAFPAHLDTRISALLDYSIEHNMVLRTRGIDPRVQLGIKELIIVRKPRAARQSTIEAVTPVSSARGSSAGSLKTPNEPLGACLRATVERETDALELGLAKVDVLLEALAGLMATISYLKLQPLTPVSSARGSSAGSLKTPNEPLGASIPSKAVCARLSNERPTL
ncbi:hypothetical protein F4604DRAFT_598339 [Suillus subluteus]|nr:hypothetical protein F4604DRAFT_598339 [Suillus subluteus]